MPGWEGATKVWGSQKRGTNCRSSGLCIVEFFYCSQYLNMAQGRWCKLFPRLDAHLGMVPLQ